MRLFVNRGRIQVKLSPAEAMDAALLDQMSRAIGSFNPSPGSDIVSCAISIQNLRKLKEFGCKLDNDPATRGLIQQLRADLTAYEEESQRGDQVKQGVFLGPDYRFKVPPFAHQVTGFHFLHSMKTPALFGACGTGKTYMVATFAESLIQAGAKMVFLVLCPVNLIRHVWEEDVAKFTSLTSASLREVQRLYIRSDDWDPDADRNDPKARSKAKRRAKARLNTKLDAKIDKCDVDFYVINFESLRTKTKEDRIRKLLKRKSSEGYSICMVIDESSRIKNPTSKTYRSIKRLRTMCERCIIMTGTPSPNGILDLWAQFSVLDGGMTLQPAFNDYRHDTCHEISPRNFTRTDRSGRERPVTWWEPKAGAPQLVYNTIQPRTIRFRTEDCIDLPPRRFIRRDVSMSKEQIAAYDDMEERLFLELEGEPVTANVAASRLMKLREITGGFLITDNKKEVPLNKNSPKMLELDTLLEQSIAPKLGDDGPPLKALIWAQYQWECRTLVDRYKKHYGSLGLFGGISQSAKDRNIRSFRDDPRCRLLVCHPASAGHGLTLTEGSYSFYYSMSYNFEELHQSIYRIYRPGQIRSTTYYFLVAPRTIDEALLAAIQQKKNLSDLITDGRFSREQLFDAQPQTNFSLEPT